MSHSIQQETKNREAMSSKQAAKYIGVSEIWLGVARSKKSPNQPPYYKLGTKIIYYRNEIDEWLLIQRHTN